MKFIVEASFPLEPFNSYVREGTVDQKIATALGPFSQRPHTSPTPGWAGAPS